jgi:RNA polymerase sigma-70 factor (ECF subfamily)
MNSKEIDERIHRLTNGEARDFAAFYETQQARIRGLVFRVCGEAELDDLVQEAFVKIWQRLDRFDGRCKLSTWCYRVALNVAIDRLRARKRAAPTVEFKEEISGRQGGQEAAAIGNDLVSRALARLDEKLRSVIVLHVFEELSINEVAEVLQVPEGTVKSRLFTARKELELYLKKEGISHETRSSR